VETLFRSSDTTEHTNKGKQKIYGVKVFCCKTGVTHSTIALYFHIIPTRLTGTLLEHRHDGLKAY